MQSGFCDSFNWRMLHDFLNEAQCLSMAYARVKIASLVDDYSHFWLHSFRGYRAPAAFDVPM